MNERVPTVTIKSEKGEPLIINQSDYDPKKHELCEEAEKPEPVNTLPAEKPEPVNTPPATVTLHVGTLKKRGAAPKFVILDASDKQVGVEEFDTEDDAKAMIELMTGQKV